MVIPQSIGGRISAKRQREAAILKYSLNPNKCLYCKKIIPVRPSEKVGWTRKKKFCGHSCSAKFNNPRIKRGAKTSPCKNCGDPVATRYYRNTYVRRKYCDLCRKLVREGNIEARTKGELFKIRKSWQAAQSDIHKHASRLYKKSGLPYKCFICGYDKHVDIHHKKHVSKFSSDTLISKINALENLVALCLNHHWEQHHGLLDARITVE